MFANHSDEAVRTVLDEVDLMNNRMVPKYMMAMDGGIDSFLSRNA